MMQTAMYLAKTAGAGKPWTEAQAGLTKHYITVRVSIHRPHLPHQQHVTPHKGELTSQTTCSFPRLQDPLAVNCERFVLIIHLYHPLHSLVPLQSRERRRATDMKQHYMLVFLFAAVVITCGARDTADEGPSTGMEEPALTSTVSVVVAPTKGR